MYNAIHSWRSAILSYWQMDEMMTEGDMPLLTWSHIKSISWHLYVFEMCVIYIYIYNNIYIYILHPKYNESITWPNTANLCLALEFPTIAGFWRIWIYGLDMGQPYEIMKWSNPDIIWDGCRGNLQRSWDSPSWHVLNCHSSSGPEKLRVSVWWIIFSLRTEITERSALIVFFWM